MAARKTEIPRLPWLLTVAAFFIGLAGSACAPRQAMHLTILHVNDTHSHLEDDRLPAVVDLKGDGHPQTIYMSAGSFPRLASKVNQVRRDNGNVLLLHAGDLVQGTLYFNRFNGSAEIDLLNRMKFDAMAVGNHEFDRGPKLLARMAGEARFPILAANLDATGDPDLKNRILPYVIKGSGGSKIGIFGLVTADVPKTSSPGKTLRFRDPATVALETVIRLKSEGVDKIIALTHIGYEADLDLARKVEGIDVVVGGHSHTLLGPYQVLGWKPAGDYPTVVKGPGGDPVLIVQAWQWADVTGVLDVNFNSLGVVTGYEGRPVVLADDHFLGADKKELSEDEKAALSSWLAANAAIEKTSEDAGLLAALDKYRSQIEPYRNKVIGRVGEDLNHVRVPGSGTGPAGPLPQGSQVAPLACESMVWKANQTGQPVQMSFTNAGGVRTSLMKGGLTIGQIYEALPFGNTIVIMELTGRQILNAVEYGVSRGDGAFPYLGNARYTADMKQPEGARITSLETRISGDWVPVFVEQTYRVAVTSYLAGGGDGYTVLADAQGYRYDTGFLDADVFEEYVESLPGGLLEPPRSTGVAYLY